MNNTLPTYAPPPLNEQWLQEKLLDWYPAHRRSVHLITDLIEEYKRFWRLVISYPHRRVVAPGPIMAVQVAHAHDREQYFENCMSYFNRFMSKSDLAWLGERDPLGAHDTVMVYQNLFQTDPPRAWLDMTRIVVEKKSAFNVV